MLEQTAHERAEAGLVLIAQRQAARVLATCTTLCACCSSTQPPALTASCPPCAISRCSPSWLAARATCLQGNARTRSGSWDQP